MKWLFFNPPRAKKTLKTGLQWTRYQICIYQLCTSLVKALRYIHTYLHNLLRYSAQKSSILVPLSVHSVIPQRHSSTLAHLRRQQSESSRRLRLSTDSGSYSSTLQLNLVKSGLAATMIKGHFAICSST